jgi:hypothetical protein
MIELKLLNIFYNFDQKFYSSFILKELTKISEFNNYELILYPENYSFNQFSNVKKILENIKEKNLDKLTKFIVITNSNDILLELSNFMMLSFVSSDNVLLYLHDNKIDKNILLNVNNINVYELDNTSKKINSIECGYFGIKSNRLKANITKGNNRFNDITGIYKSYSSFNKEYYSLMKKD